MGLRSDIQTDIAAAFNTDLADAVESFVLDSITIGAYDAVTGTSARTVTSYRSRGVFDNLTEAQLADENVKPTDSNLIVLQNELGVMPKVDDEVTMESSKRFVVLSVNPDPANATWNMAVRSG